MKKSGLAKSPSSSNSKGKASAASKNRRGANSPSSKTQATRGSAPVAVDFDPTSKPQRAGAARNTGSKSGGGSR